MIQIETTVLLCKIDIKEIKITVHKVVTTMIQIKTMMF